MLKSRLLPAMVALVITAAAHNATASELSPNFSVGAAEADSMIAAISGAAGKLGRQANIPTLLSEEDASAYRAAFRAQDSGQWAAADREIARIQDPVLLGHVLAQRYLSPGYQVSSDDLRDWMMQYADLPQAEDIYDLAKRRHVVGLRPPSRPEPFARTRSSKTEDAVWEDFSIDPNPDLSAGERRRVVSLKDRFRDLVSEHAFDQAVSMLDSSEMTRLFEKADYDELKTVLAVEYFSSGRDGDAIRWAEEAAERSGDKLPEAHWVAGLAQWRNGQKAESARHFEAVANSHEASTWLTAAGAYWASRANLAARRPEVVNHWLTQAAAYPRTLYGQMARKALGQSVQYSWESRPFTDLDAETLARVPGSRRTLALLQIDDRYRAEEEMRVLSRSAGPALSQSMLALSNAGGMPAMTVRLSSMLGDRDGQQRDSGNYPLPDWKPTSGWNIDRALVLAIARQESSFNPKAKSPAGAIGLMQLMPSTARLMGGGKLTDPSVNLELGQRYVRRLLEDDAIKGNLLFLAASYNSGPGAVGRWLQTVRHNGDALLFLESIPSHETRAFVARVLTNFWTYRDRLNQTSPSLEAIAAGDWPMYDKGDFKISAVKNVKN